MFTVLLNVDDWRKYCEGMVAQLQLGTLKVEWGGGPKEYPCMVSSYLPTRTPGIPPKIISAYVYEHDVDRLKAAIAAAAPEAPAVADTVQPTTQGQFNRWVAAHILTIASFLTSTAICREGQYEAKLTEMLEKADEFAISDQDKIRAMVGPAKP